MEEVLEKINEYGMKKIGATLSLVIEKDGSCLLTKNAFDFDSKSFFEFNKLGELYKEIGYNK